LEKKIPTPDEIRATFEAGEPIEKKETHTLEADSPEKCDAWEVWVDELKTVRELLRNVWTAASGWPCRTGGASAPGLGVRWARATPGQQTLT
jgi:hypothetical protein